MSRTSASLSNVGVVLGAMSAFVLPAKQLAAQPAPSWIQPEIAPGTVSDTPEGVSVEEQFTTAIPADATFEDHTGRSVRIGELLGGRKPVVLNLVYHQCASFCDMALRALGDALAQQPWTVGNEFQVITLSIDPRDTSATIAEARARTLGRYGRDEAEHGWHFLRGSEEQIRRVTDAIGYHYAWDARGQQYAHPGALVVLQPSGTPARYLYGLDLPHNDLRLALLEASEGRHLATSEQVIRASLLYCFRWDHSDGRYVLAARNLMKAGGLLTMAILGGFLFVFWRRERRATAAHSAGSKAPPPASASHSSMS